MSPDIIFLHQIIGHYQDDVRRLATSRRKLENKEQQKHTSPPITSLHSNTDIQSSLISAAAALGLSSEHPGQLTDKDHTQGAGQEKAAPARTKTHILQRIIQSRK